MKIGDASKVWNDGQHLRNFYLQQATQASQLTMPILIPESDQWSPTTSYHQNKLPVLYQGLGGRGLYNLASKLLLTLYPPSQPMFRIQLSEAFLEQQLGGMAQAERQQMMRRLQRQTVLYERQILSQMEKLNVRAMLAELLMHLLCGGNTMAYIGNPRARFYPFRTFMWRMDSERNIRLAIIREKIYPEYLPPGVKPKETKEPTAKQSGMDDQQEDIYTVIHINPKASTPAEQVQWHQEYDNKKVPNSDGASPINGSPWIMSRLYSAAGEPYCRNYFETSSLGDLTSLEELQKGIVTGTLAGLKRLFRTSPNSYVLPRQVEEAMTGDCLEANEGDVGEVGDPGRWGASIQSLMPMMQMITDRVSKECLLTEAVQRDAERVTAEEIQTMVQELETSRAGLYSGMVDRGAAADHPGGPQAIGQGWIRPRSAGRHRRYSGAGRHGCHRPDQ
jgi:hypothetical protein